MNFIHSFIHSFINSFIHSLTNSGIELPRQLCQLRWHHSSHWQIQVWIWYLFFLLWFWFRFFFLYYGQIKFRPLYYVQTRTLGGRRTFRPPRWFRGGGRGPHPGVLYPLFLVWIKMTFIGQMRRLNQISLEGNIFLFEIFGSKP